MSVSTTTHPPTPIAVVSPDAPALAFRRADGSRREFFFDDSLRSLPHPAASIFLLSRSPAATLPRNVLRLFRQDNDEPSRHVHFVRETRQSVCRDGQDRSRCSECRETVANTPAPGKTAHHWFMMSPQRVFRDIVMSDVAEPFKPALREALFQAYNATVEVSQQKGDWPRRKRPQSATQQQLSGFAHLSMSRPVLPSPPPSPTRPGRQTDETAEESDDNVEGDNTPSSPTEFRHFPRLPFEIRRMIWEQALPSRVLLRDDLGQSTYRSVRHVFRPVSHTHSLELLWRSDLFYSCAEARRVVEALHDSVQRPSKTSPAEMRTSPEEEPMAPLLRQATTRTRLRSGLDILYYPWLGSESIHGHSGGGGPWNAERYQPGHHDSSGSMPYASHQSWIAKLDNVTAGSLSASPPSSQSSSNPSSPSTSLAPPAAAAITSARISAVPYGHWATQLRLLRLPISTVALDASWIDRGHADTLEWAAGLDVSESETEEPGDTRRSDHIFSPPTSLQLVVADILVPIRIDLDSNGTRHVLTPAQRRLLRQHIAPQPWIDTRTRRHDQESGREAPRVPTSSFSSSASSASSSSSPASPASPPATNLNGMDVTVLVDLYDDWRIEELLSLQVGTAGGVLNKSALHRCIACTRTAWEARDHVYWTTKFGPLLGARLQNLCRPTIVFSIIMAFEGGDDNDEAAEVKDD